MLDVDKILARIDSMNPDDAVQVLKNALDAAYVPYQTEIGNIEFDDIFPDTGLVGNTFSTSLSLHADSSKFSIDSDSKIPHISFEGTIKSEPYKFMKATEIIAA